MDILNVSRSSFMSGICIGIAGFGFLSLKADGNYLAGCCIFAFALIAVVNYKLALYTGTAGFIKKNEFGFLGLVLLGNIVGCATLSLLTRLSPMPIQEMAQALLQSRLAMGVANGALLSIACGFIMTTAVTFARKGSMLTLLFGVPLFIVCGFPHCIADAFFYSCVPLDFWWAHLGEILIFYVSIVLGNFVGCNFYRGVMGSNP
ncbi:MAG: formate/nitrite transporter family protein [Akkermansiaceae bacterium]|nr:formate/nitrite transporter family protein [Akkermansiaceae bacterium]